jgi:hypothetical protein
MDVLMKRSMLGGRILFFERDGRTISRSVIFIFTGEIHRFRLRTWLEEAGKLALKSTFFLTLKRKNSDD